MKVLYLFNRVRKNYVDDVRSGKELDSPFFGMFRLPHYGVEAEYLEIEQFFPEKITQFLRRYFLNVYYVHAPLFFKFFKYDVIFSSTAFGSLALKAILPIKKFKWVMFDFSISGIVGERSTLKQKLFYFIIKYGTDGIITISHEEAERVKKLFPKIATCVEYIPLGTDTDFWTPTERAPEKGRILSLCKDPYRDVETLVKAVENLDVNVTLTVKSGRLKNICLPENVTEKDFTTHELREAFSEAEVFVLPLTLRDHLNDAVGTSTVIEAMSMGKAIIATETYSMQSYITHEVTGVFVPEGDALALKNAIVDLLNDEPKRKRLGEAARKFALENCTAEKFAESLAFYFNQLSKS